MKTNKTIISFGECLFDGISGVYVPGGAPLNFAFACQQISDCDVAMISEVSRMGCPDVEVVDTVGCGDSFCAAFVSALAAGFSLQATHHLASEVSSFVATQRGGQPLIPERYHVASLGKMDMLNL